MLFKEGFSFEETFQNGSAALPPDFNLLSKTYEPILFLEPDEHTDEFEDFPNSSRIAGLCNIYYPVLLSLHAPPLYHGCSTPGCINVDTLHQCLTCFNPSTYCSSCIKLQHTHQPFHKLRTWDDHAHCYISTCLADIGMIWSLFHEDGTTCSSQGSTRKIQVLHTNGLHSISYYLCRCHLQIQNPQTVSPKQLLVNRLFPATDKSPTSAFTFELLELFDSLNLIGFINFKQFCDAVMGCSSKDSQNHGEVSKTCNNHSQILINILCLGNWKLTN